MSELKQQVTVHENSETISRRYTCVCDQFAALHICMHAMAVAKVCGEKELLCESFSQFVTKEQEQQEHEQRGYATGNYSL